MAHTSGRNLFCLYPLLLQTVNKEGQEAAPRNKPVVEMLHPTMWSLTHPQEWALFIPGRKINPFFALAEVVWMWSGKGGADFIQFYNKSITQFLDKGVPYFHGSYGKRVRHAGYSETPFRELPHLTNGSGTANGPVEVEVDQLQHVIRKLQGDPETRQAVVVLWDPVKDNWVQSMDHPCNNVLYFWMRPVKKSATRWKLNMTVVRRSNDLVWGVPYNMVQFSHLQALVAGALNAAIGEYHVMANNLHYYKELYPDTLTNVLGWSENVNRNRVDLEDVTHTFYDKDWDMRWDLAHFDDFVKLEWEPLEHQSRNYLEHQLVQVHEHSSSPTVAQGTIEAFYNTRIMHLEQAFEEHSVPTYWKHVFRLLLAYHCRKAKADNLFSSLISQLPRPLQWLVNDFVSKEPAHV